ncbi:hypothetical protein Gogos_017469 [Gossypium gossypioides]|uniref:Pectinesterase inhibitor domain-containing protein n=1 Tax=Gossypium gossypioides TaxID=34282 RepID=A0A7J9BAS5_GOSGO|nr:hypothetical protein [Gossypium gossypioides]
MNTHSLKLLLILLTITFPSTQCDDDLVDQICKKTPFYDLCISTLKSNSNGKDVKGLASVMADTMLSNATDTLSYIRAEINRTPDPKIERALAYCAELYIPVVKYNLPQAIDALSKGQFEFAADGISDAAKEADSCEKMISWSQELAALSDRNKLIHSLSDVAVAIVKILLKD